MSSFIGHAATGAAIYLFRNPLSAPQTRWLLSLTIFLAISPDLDYLAFWFWGLDFKPRLSHSILFGLIDSSIAWGIILLLTRNASAKLFLLLATASCSHVLLDLLVGVHGLPLLWPLSKADIALPFGILPSAGRLDLRNFYLWRNLGIECGILLPILIVLVWKGRGYAIGQMRFKILLLSVFWVNLIWSLSLHR